ncbi:MAG: diphosphomevalonate decarboxylase [Lactobacillaceae bacterium]|jgi:diphosphomevalonate decarboxylase|nr:diphosphomevalonate decarboxylase [Lactobacillaceae bacterium]
MIYQARSRAFTNIALTKYWGKVDSTNAPTTTSIGLTLDKFSTTTKVTFSSEFSVDEFYLDGKRIESPKIEKVINFVREKYRVDLPARIDSTNDVPMAAGFASSASAFAALAYSIDQALELKLTSPEISEIARIGSGSASRSIFGGFSIWSNQPPYYAESLLSQVNFDIKIVDILTNTDVKKVSSTNGMQMALTSPLYKKWVLDSTKTNAEMIDAIENGDLEKIGIIAENNALFMHKLNRTSARPFDYFTDETLEIIETVKKMRSEGFLTFSTIDAGPNVKIITDSTGVQRIKSQFDENKILVQEPGIGAYNV